MFISGNTVRQSLVYFTSWSRTSACLSALLRAKTAQSSNTDTVCYLKNEGNQVLSQNFWLIFMIFLASLLLLLVKIECVALIFGMVWSKRDVIYSKEKSKSSEWDIISKECGFRRRSIKTPDGALFIMTILICTLVTQNIYFANSCQF